MSISLSMSNWSLFLMLGVTAIWIAVLSAVAYLVVHAPTQR
jgi:hypothetical protein